MKTAGIIAFVFTLGLLSVALASAAQNRAAAQQPQIHWFGYAFTPNQGQAEVLSGDSHSVILPAGCSKLIRWDVGINVLGSAMFDVRRGSFNTDPNSATSITNGNSPTITGAFQNFSVDLSGWQSVTQAGDRYVIYVTSISPGVTDAPVEISCQQ